ncbi:endospore germination permease [Paenibacillus sp. GD4]|jgi:spore germination protein|uniref:GerAB/ArcD/ProY family transporter n=1 Tax=Paenibacillus sp. GD4 TaxID=3068890 RepID=UPI00279694A2|nr:endospore germination permease [Paenibacillus sp. GD4]MDQ1910588.1 endospore germination permease [Paenibacillus sp. GD4]
METPKQITTIQAAAILISTIIGVGVLPLPLFAVRAADTGAILVTMIAILIASASLWLITKLGQRFPSLTLVQYSDLLIGKALSRTTIMLIVLFFALLTSLAAREFGEVVITSVLKKTPLEITVLAMLLLATISARNDLTTFTYIHHFYLPLIVFPAILIVALSLKNAQLVYMQPIWGSGPIPQMLPGILTIAALFQGSFVYTMVIPHLRNPARAMKGSFWGMLIAGGLYLSIVVAAVGVFGTEETKKLLWPTLELAKTTTLPGNILERLDAAFLAVWVTAVFTTLFSSYYFTVHTLSKVVGLRDHKLLSLFILPTLFAMAMYPENILDMYEIVAVVGQLGLILTIGYPLLLLIIAVLRKKRGPSHEQKQGNPAT